MSDTNAEIAISQYGHILVPRLEPDMRPEEAERMTEERAEFQNKANAEWKKREEMFTKREARQPRPDRAAALEAALRTVHPGTEQDMVLAVAEKYAAWLTQE